MTEARPIQVLLRNRYRPWYRSEMSHPTDGVVVTWARGHAWDGETYLEGQGLSDWLCERLQGNPAFSRQAFEDAVIAIQGFFALVAETPVVLLAAVDHVRSIPLFYGAKGRDLLVSDDAYAVRAFVDDREIDDLAAKELMVATWVTGEDTVCRGVKGIRAGSYIWADCTRPGEVGKAQYYAFASNERPGVRPEDLYPLAQATYQLIFRRLVQSAQGRQIVVPLSGAASTRAPWPPCSN